MSPNDHRCDNLIGVGIVDRPENKKAPTWEPSKLMNDARGCISANRDRFPDHLVQPGDDLALVPLHFLTFSQFGGKIVFGWVILRRHL